MKDRTVADGGTGLRFTIAPRQWPVRLLRNAYGYVAYRYPTLLQRNPEQTHMVTLQLDEHRKGTV